MKRCTEPGRSVDPLKCPKRCPEPVEGCGEEMKIIAFIKRDQVEVIERILKHCNLWKDRVPRSPPKKVLPQDSDTKTGPRYDYKFFDSVCA